MMAWLSMKQFMGDDSMNKFDFPRFIGLLLLAMTLVAVVGWRYKAIAEPPQQWRAVTVVRHEFADATCFTVVWNLKPGRERQVRLDCVGK